MDTLASSDNQPANLPQPVDYGLTYEETFDGLYLSEGRFRDELPDYGFTKFTYKTGEWVPFWSGRAVAIWLVLYTVGFAIIAAFNSSPGDWKWNNPRAFAFFFLAMVFPGGFLLGITCAVVRGIREGHKRRHPSASLLAFRRALSEHKSRLSAAREGAQRREALLRQKRAYWDTLNGYQFEIATADVLKLHRFNPKLTGGAADGGVDIEVSRDGLKGVVQCKAHAASIGPHTVRDLFGVIHHSRADFGVIVSRGGFTAGAVAFARDKPIFLIDASDLVAMAEGKDVLEAVFTRPKAT